MLKDSFDNAHTDIKSRHLNEAIVEGKRVILSINSALKIDGSDLLNEKELKYIYKARDELEEMLNSGEKESIIDAVKNLEKVSETYVSRRMNSNIQKIMKGTDIKEFN